MTNAVVIKPPTKFPFQLTGNGILEKSIFLAGSIEMGAAELWQDKVINEINHFYSYILNPRRDDWDSSWAQSINNQHFNEQVNWELTALEMAESILIYFDPNTKSPISLLELGLFARSKKMIVCCPDGFYRKGNVDIVCKKYNIPCCDKLSTAIFQLQYYR